MPVLWWLKDEVPRDLLHDTDKPFSAEVFGDFEPVELSLPVMGAVLHMATGILNLWSFHSGCDEGCAALFGIGAAKGQNVQPLTSSKPRREVVAGIL